MRNKTATQKAAALAGSTAAAFTAVAPPTTNAAIVVAANVPSPVVSAGGTTNFDWDIDGDLQADFSLSTIGGRGILHSEGRSGRGVVYQTNEGIYSQDIQNLTTNFIVGPTLETSYGWGASGQIRTMTNNGTRVGYDFKGGIFGSDENYIGFRFNISGNTHYGWAQLNLASQQIIGGAYNNTPGGAIQVGQIPEPSSMALLGLGAAGLAMLRRRKEC